MEVTNFLTPPGRMVGGDCFVGQTTDAEGRPLVIKTGPNAGQARVDYYIGLAIPKNDPGWPAFWALIVNEARISFPQLHDAAGNCIMPTFSYKKVDGDSQIPNKNGVVPSSKEGYPGHWILGFSGGFAPKCYSTGGEELIVDPAMIKRGCYIRVYGTVKGNQSTQQPGVYLNHRMVELIGYGDEIISGPDGKAIFGATGAAMPVGASATPVAPAASIAHPAPLVPPAGVAAPLVPPAGVAAPPVQPATGVVAPPPVGVVTPAPDFLNPPPVKYTTADGNAWTEADLVAAGYLPAQIQALPRA